MTKTENTKIHDSHCLVEHQKSEKHLENVEMTHLSWYSVAKWPIRWRPRQDLCVKLQMACSRCRFYPRLSYCTEQSTFHQKRIVHEALVIIASLNGEEVWNVNVEE